MRHSTTPPRRQFVLAQEVPFAGNSDGAPLRLRTQSGCTSPATTVPRAPADRFQGQRPRDLPSSVRFEAVESDQNSWLAQRDILGLLNDFTNRLQKPRRRRAIHDSMIKSQAEGQHVSWHKLVFQEDRSLVNAAN